MSVDHRTILNQMVPRRTDRNHLFPDGGDISLCGGLRRPASAAAYGPSRPTCSLCIELRIWDDELYANDSHDLG